MKSKVYREFYHYIVYKAIQKDVVLELWIMNVFKPDF